MVVALLPELLSLVDQQVLLILHLCIVFKWTLSLLWKTNLGSVLGSLFVCCMSMMTDGCV